MSKQKTPKLKVDPEFHAMLIPLEPEERQQLEENIIADGRCIDPLLVWNDLIIDGHNRYEICIVNKIPFKTQQIEFADRDEAIDWIELHQFGRRNLAPFRKVEMALRRKERLEARAKANQQAGGQSAKVGRQNSDEPLRTDEAIAKRAGVSRDTVRKVEVIKEKAPKKLQAKVRSGEISINKAHKELKAEPEPPCHSRKSVCDALANAAHHDRVLNLITQISTTMNELMGDGDSSKPLSGGELLTHFRQQIKGDIKNLRETVKAAKPHAVCPYCKGDGRKCNACKGLGWVSKQIFDESPAEMKGAKAA